MSQVVTATDVSETNTSQAKLSGHASLLIHRDLSWLQFNSRVLDEAKDTGNPLMERVKFVAISASNLDEFFMIRFASLNRAISTHLRHGHEEQAAHLQSVRASIVTEVKRLQARQSQTLHALIRAVSAHSIRIVTPEDRNPLATQLGKKIFDEQILPHIGPPEAFHLRMLRSLGNLQIAAIFANNTWCVIPKTLSQCYWTTSPDGGCHIFFLDTLLTHHLAEAVGAPGTPGLIRLTRDGDVTLDLEEEDTESIPDAIRTRLGGREYGRPVRLQYSGAIGEKFLEQCAAQTKVDPNRVLPAPRSLCLHGLTSAINQLPEAVKSNVMLYHPPLPSLVPPAFKRGRGIFQTLKRKDLLLHHPYDSFDAFVTFIREASRDPEVTSIEMTAYRTDAVSPIIDCLKSCAQTKRVRVIIELRARFDELNNLRIAEELRKAGAEVAFGFGKLKVHAKIALVTRMENNQPQHYTHLSTGNYNAVTARGYTDLSVLTSNAEIGLDARTFFDAVAKGEVPSAFKRVVSAPTRLHRRILSHIEAETRAAQEGKKARIVAKVNALVDEQIIESLYRASNAGVKVDLIVRGACSLVPGVPGMSENIRVISIVDRFLEHSRIYFFESSNAMYISSADWMPRNFFSRLELAYPVLDHRIRKFIEEIIIPGYLSDNVKARELTPSGEWKPVAVAAGAPRIRSQFYFHELATGGYRKTSLE